MTKNPRWWAWFFRMLPDPTNLPRSKFDLQNGFSLNSDSTNGVDPWTYGKCLGAQLFRVLNALSFLCDRFHPWSIYCGCTGTCPIGSKQFDVKTLHRIKTLFLCYSLLHQTTKPVPPGIPPSWSLQASKLCGYLVTEIRTLSITDATSIYSEFWRNRVLSFSDSKKECKVNLQKVRSQPSLVRLPWKPLVGSSTNVWSWPVPGSAEAAVKGDAACEVLGCNQWFQGYIRRWDSGPVPSKRAKQPRISHIYTRHTMRTSAAAAAASLGTKWLRRRVRFGASVSSVTSCSLASVASKRANLKDQRTWSASDSRNLLRLFKIHFKERKELLRNGLTEAAIAFSLLPVPCFGYIISMMQWPFPPTSGAVDG